MAGACPASLSIAVANAGGMGAMGAVMTSPGGIRDWVKEFRAASTGSFQLTSLAIVPLQRVLEKVLSQESRTRADILLKKLKEPHLTPDHQRVLAAIEVLAQMRTDKAIALLHETEREALVPQRHGPARLPFRPTCLAVFRET
jgi:NAD(P)H-dependent flavin oxidoreductase YrpB (nitropropane dioxygenase family)